MGRGETIALYMGTMIIAVIAAFLSQRRKGTVRNTSYYTFYNSRFAFSFLILWFVSSFTNIGVDYNAYIRIIRVSGFDSIWNGEIGFNYLCMLLKFLCRDNYDLCIFILKTITLLIFYRSLYLLRGHMRIGWGVFAFVLMSYLRWYLISMHLAAALILLSVTYLYLGSKKRGILYYVFAIAIHYSCIFLLPMYFLFYVIPTRKKKFSTLQLFILIAGYLIAFFSIYQIYNYMTSTFAAFYQYSQYTFITDYSGLGIMQIIFYIPVFYMIVMAYRCSENKNLINLSIVMAFTGFFFAMLGYRLQVISRMYEYFMGIYMICVPVLFYERKTGQDLKGQRFLMTYQSDVLIWIIAILMRGFDVLNDILQIVSSAQMDHWKFFFPF